MDAHGGQHVLQEGLGAPLHVVTALSHADLRGNKRNPGDVIQDGTTQPSHSLGNVPTGRRCSPEEGGGGGRRLGWVFSVWLTSQGMLTLCTLVYRDRDEKKS